MSFFTIHIHRVLTEYKGHPPLSLFLKQYFKAYPKLGSRDRKALAEAAFLYYRCRSFFSDALSVEEVIVNAWHLCNSKNKFLAKMLSIDVTASMTASPVYQKDIRFNVSEGLAEERWLRSIRNQPQLFIRLRKHQERSRNILRENGILFDSLAGPDGVLTDCIKIGNGSNIESLLPSSDFVVQDWSSQQSIAVLLKMMDDAPANVWDVCSGAGGKSILLKDSLPPFALTVSDVRKSILHNLRMRFKQYGLTGLHSFVGNSADVAVLAKEIGGQSFDLVLCDVPCSGSGTWARTPEQFYFFEPSMLQKYIDLQFPIAANAAKYVKAGGYLAYVTCSVFRQENEMVVERLLQLNNLELIAQQIIDGIDEQADCMFIAVFRKR